MKTQRLERTPATISSHKEDIIRKLKFLSNKIKESVEILLQNQVEPIEGCSDHQRLCEDVSILIAQTEKEIRNIVPDGYENVMFGGEGEDVSFKQGIIQSLIKLINEILGENKQLKFRIGGSLEINEEYLQQLIDTKKLTAPNREDMSRIDKQYEKGFK